jgi:glycerol-3-phosphate dehydrogenase (NAD(P)+)
MNRRPVTILGTGAWGTALALVLCRKGIGVRMRAYLPEIASDLEASRENVNFLPGFLFPPELHVMYDIGAALEGSEAVVVAVPSQVIRSVLAAVPPGAVAGRDWVIATKGLEEGSGLRMSEVVHEALPDARTAVLAGPSLALEVAAGQPTTVLAASRDVACAERVRDLFHDLAFRVYTNDDLVGVELGTALKNVIALAAGIASGMGLGANAHGAILTRGLAETMRLGAVLGARRETFLGLAGVGDLVTTCSSPLSRNRTLGERIGRGMPVAQALASMTQVAEGVPTTRSAVGLARRHRIEMPITEQVHRVLFEGLDPREALRALMERPPRMEGEE